MLRLLLVSLLIVMTTASTHEDDDYVYLDDISGNKDYNTDKGHDVLLEEYPNRDIDPSDILNYDPATQTMTNWKDRKTVIDMTLLEECRLDLTQCRQNLVDFHEKTLINAMYDKQDAINKVTSCQKEMKACQDDLSDCKVGCSELAASKQDTGGDAPCGAQHMFFRRFAKKIIELLITEKEQEDSWLDAEVRVKLHPYDWSKLRQFVQQKGKVKLVDAHDLMTDMLLSARHDNNVHKSSWLERMTGMELTDIKFYSLLIILTIILVAFESITQSSWRQQLCSLFVVIFVISIVWNWIYLNKKEFAKRTAEFQKMEDKDMPATCRPSKMSWWESVGEVFRKQWTFQDDPCSEYHSKYLVDPIYEVPPTRALSHTISIMLFEPLQHLGKSLAEFHRELLKDLPVQAWIPALLSPYLMVGFVMLVLWYCPRQGHRRMANDVYRIQMLETQLRNERAIQQRNNRIEAIERDANAALQQAPPLPARPHVEAPQALNQRPPHRDDLAEPAAGSRSQARGKRRQRMPSNSHVQHRQQQSAPYHGDVSDGNDSSDEMDSQLQHLPLHVRQEQAFPPRKSTSVAAAKSGDRTTVFQGQPVQCPASEVDSMEGHNEVRSQPPSNIGWVDAQHATGEASNPIRGSGAQKNRDLAIDERGAAGGAPAKELEAKIIKDKSKSRDVAGKALTPSSSTDSETFLPSPQGCDSPSSVSVIEGDSSPISGGSIDGDSHLQGLGISLSGSIDIIEPQEVLEGDRAGNDEGPDSDEFEVLSREQCQTMG